MTRLLFATAFLLGAAAVVWIGADFAGSNALAFTVTGVIGGVYLLGIAELLQFRRATASLADALASVPAKSADAAGWLGEWLGRLDPSLQNAVRLRIEGERVGLPAPVLTPYLVGLLVMLGLLGTFMGMVDTLSGAVLALEGSTELEAIRAGLAAPIRGLGVAFGTSVAGVAASAMLGLISTLCRRERMLATRQLDSSIATVFRDFSLDFNRREAYRAMQLQAQALPDVAASLQTLAGQLESMGNTLGERLLANQALFHDTVHTSYTELARSVDTSLRESLSASGAAAGDSMKPVVAEAMTGISLMARDSQQQLISSARDQLQAIGERFEATGNAMVGEIGTLLQSTEALVQARIAAEATWLGSHGERMEQLTATLKAELAGLRDQEALRQDAAANRLAELESTVTTHLARLGAGLEEPMTRLIETASETPRAAADVIAQLRAEIGNNIERDNNLLEERQRIMTELNTLSASLLQASTGQHQAVENLVNNSANMLQDVSARFGEHVAAEAAKISEATANFGGSAVELSSLGESFNHAVNLFNASNENLVEHLARIEESMDRSSARSDEQMAYYVAQAREIIDQSMLSQRDIIEDLARLRRKEQLLTAGAG